MPRLITLETNSGTRLTFAILATIAAIAAGSPRIRDAAASTVSAATLSTDAASGSTAISAARATRGVAVTRFAA
jgi:hypothetical protein